MNWARDRVPCYQTGSKKHQWISGLLLPARHYNRSTRQTIYGSVSSEIGAVAACNATKVIVREGRNAAYVLHTQALTDRVVDKRSQRRIIIETANLPVKRIECESRKHISTINSHHPVSNRVVLIGGENAKRILLRNELASLIVYAC